MRRIMLLAFSLSLAVVSAAYADIPLPSDLKYVEPRVQFEGIDKYADKVFCLRFLTFTGGPAGVPYKLVEVKDIKPFNLKAQRRLINVSLLAMDRKEFEKRAKDDSSLKWLTDKTDGVLAAPIRTPSTVVSVKEKEAPVTTYRVTLKDGKLSAEMVKDQKRSEAAPTGLMPLWLFGVISAVSFTCFGLWAARRHQSAP